MSLAIDFVNVPPKELEREIDRALRMTGEFTGVDRSYTFPYDFERQITSNTHEWCREDAVRQRKSWSPEELTLLRMLAELFTNAESGKRRVEALEGERRKAESAERLLRRAVEVGKAAIWETDEKSECLHCVSGWAGLLGEEMDNTWIPLAEFYARMHPDDLPRVLGHVAVAAGLPGKTLQVSFRVRHRDARWIPVIARGFFEFDSAGQLLRISGSTIDVTETLLEDEKARKRLEMDSKLLPISSRFVDVECYDFAVNSALHDVGQFSGACRTHLIILDRERQVMNNSHEWCAPGITSEIVASQNLHLSIIRDFLPQPLQLVDQLLAEDTKAMDALEFFQNALNNNNLCNENHF